MKRKSSILVLILTLALTTSLLTGCASLFSIWSWDSVGSDIQPSYEEITNPTSENQTGEDDNFEDETTLFNSISIVYAPPEFLEQADYYDFTVDESDYQIQALITTESILSDFSVYNLDLQDVSEQGDLYYIGDKIYELEELTADKPLVLRFTLMGIMPTVGISYRVGDELYVLGLNSSGKDGSLIFSEIFIEE